MCQVIIYGQYLLHVEFINIETALDFTKYLRAEPQIVVWNTVLTQLRPIFNKLTLTGDAFGAFKVKAIMKYRVTP